MNSQLGIQDEGEFEVMHIAETDDVRESEGCH